MQRNIFSVDRIPKVKDKLGKTIAFVSLSFGTACIQILLSPLAGLAQSSSSASPHPVGDFLAWIFFNSLKLGIIWLIILHVWTWIQSNVFGIESEYDAHQASLARKQEIQKIYDSLTPEQQREVDRDRREHQRELDDIIRSGNQEKQHKDHQDLIVKMEKERIARENKIRDFRNRRGREPNSWEI